jgi:hypothetical protein
MQSNPGLNPDAGKTGVRKLAPSASPTVTAMHERILSNNSNSTVMLLFRGCTLWWRCDTDCNHSPSLSHASLNTVCILVQQIVEASQVHHPQTLIALT